MPIVIAITCRRSQFDPSAQTSMQYQNCGVSSVNNRPGRHLSCVSSGKDVLSPTRESSLDERRKDNKTNVGEWQMLVSGNELVSIVSFCCIYVSFMAFGNR